MTPLDKAREALAAVEKATAGPWVQSGCIIRAYDANGACVMALYDEGGHDEPDAAAIVTAVNFVRADLPALIGYAERAAGIIVSMAAEQEVAAAEHERLADRVAKLERALDALALALTDRGHTWTPEQRSLYEAATQQKG